MRIHLVSPLIILKLARNITPKKKKLETNFLGKRYKVLKMANNKKNCTISFSTGLAVFTRSHYVVGVLS